MIALEFGSCNIIEGLLSFAGSSIIGKDNGSFVRVGGESSVIELRTTPYDPF